MQLQIRTQDGDFIVIDLQHSEITPGQPQDGTELIAASIVDSKLSILSHDQFFDILGETVDYFSRPAQPTPASDWYKDEFLPATATPIRKAAS